MQFSIELSMNRAGREKSTKIRVSKNVAVCCFIYLFIFQTKLIDFSKIECLVNVLLK